MIVLDSCYIVSLIVATENAHKKAVELSKRLDNEKLIITNTILIETLDILTKRLKQDTNSIIEIYNTIKNNFKIIHENKPITNKSMKIVIKYNNKIGLADAITIGRIKDIPNI